MTDPIASHSQSGQPQRARVALPEKRTLNYQEVYTCPVCRHGEIASLTLMDAFACNFCRHIFTANLREQTIRVEDSSQPMVWRWNGYNWLMANRLDGDLTVAVWLVGIALVALPPLLIWLSSHTFPPLPESGWYWFPTVWMILTFTCHFLFVAWLLAEHYQFPLYVACKVKLRELLGRR